MKLVKKGCILFLSIVLLGWIANVLAFLLPQNLIHANIAKSADVLQQESVFFPIIGERYRNSIADNNTDAWMLLMADYDGEEGLLKKSVGGFFHVYEDSTVSGLLGYDSFVTSHNNDAKISGTYSYARYWNGWVFPLRVLLLFFSYEDIRYLSMAAISFLMFYFIYLLLEKNKKGYAVAAATTILMMTPITAMVSFEYAFIMYITLISNIFLVKHLDGLLQKDLILLFFLGMGMIVSYVDFLTYPIVTLGFCLVTYLMMAGKRIESAGREIVQVVTASVAWGIGYVGMWVTKWIISTWILKWNVVAEGISQFLVRSSSTMGNGGASDPTITYGQVLKTVIGIFAKKGYFVLGVFGLALILVWSKKFVKRSLTEKQFLRMTVPYFLVFCMPFVWAFVCKNHTYTHMNYTANIFSLSYLAVASCLAIWGNRGTARE